MRYVFAEYKRVPSKRFWKKHFSHKKFKELLEEARKSKFIEIISSTIPKNSRIVEAGTGFGRYVKVLSEKGFKNVEGFDINKDLLDTGRKRGLKVKYGSVLNMPYNNNIFDVYIDMGVIEHFSFDEQKKILAEAKRILKKRGVAFINVPYMNTFRKLVFPIMFIKNYLRKLKGKKFYQYIYTKKQICRLIEEADFKVTKVYPRDVRIMVMAKK